MTCDCCGHSVGVESYGDGAWGLCRVCAVMAIQGDGRVLNTGNTLKELGPVVTGEILKRFVTSSLVNLMDTPELDRLPKRLRGLR